MMKLKALLFLCCIKLAKYFIKDKKIITNSVNKDVGNFYKKYQFTLNYNF